MNFASDNAYGVSPEIIDALVRVNEGASSSYGGDEITAQLGEEMAKLFETEVAVFPVPSGTGANALALSTMVPSFGAVLCHEEAHINVDECGAVELYSGGCKLIGLPGRGAQLTAEGLKERLAGFVRGDHDPRRCAVSITQASELGTVYSLAEIGAIGAVCKDHGMKLHLDGARFANALVSLDCTPAEMTWKAGVDAVSFGVSKNGGMITDAVVFFDTALAEDFDRRRLQGGQLIAKGRYASAQILAYLEDDLWLNNARHANAMAAKLSAGLEGVEGVRLHAPTQANEVFAVLPASVHAALQKAGAVYHCWPPNPNSGPVPSEPGDVLARLVTSFAAREEDVDGFLMSAAG
ncbi:MAG: low specificity L-threonine aldolase [Pseudomonadota bacterium]